MGSKTPTKKEPKKPKAQENAGTAQEPQPESALEPEEVKSEGASEPESVPDPEPINIADMQTIIEALAKTVSEHTEQITELHSP